MTGFIEAAIDVDRFDFLEDLEFADNELVDCTFDKEELEMFLAPPQEKWTDYFSASNPAVITMDSAKKTLWQIARDEMIHVRKRMRELLRMEEDVEDGLSVTNRQILLFTIGPKSKIGDFLRDELDLDKETYLKFMSTACVQAAYRLSTFQLFHAQSLLKDSIVMGEKEYVQIWKRIAEKRKLPNHAMSTSRREPPLWETLEKIVNDLLRSISIAGRDGGISIALDDDKIWLQLSSGMKVDLFDLKYTTHVQANRKGLNAHTAVSTGANVPLGIVFERTNDSTKNCFVRLLDHLFSRNGSTDLQNVSVHSDRGYMLPDLVFQYLLSCGADVVGTVKRMAQCWPFTYDQNLKASDKRTLIDKKGAPTLFLKWCKAGGAKHIFASAFRSGTDRVATAVSTLHSQHQWEGVAMKPAELIRYRGDSRSLIGDFFQRVPSSFFLDPETGAEMDESDDAKEMIAWLLRDVIVPFTLQQGKFILILSYY